MKYQYHLFVSYSHVDAGEVLRVVADLKARGLEVWVDKQQDMLGQRLSEALEAEMRKCLSIGVFIRTEDMGQYHRDEANAALELARAGQGVDVYPVVLPSAAQDLRVPIFLSGRGGVDLRTSYEAEVDRFARTLRQRWDRLVAAEEEEARKAAEQEAAARSAASPADDEADEADEEDDEDDQTDALEEILATFHERPPTIFIGGRFPREAGLPPSACHVAHGLLSELQIVDVTKTHDGILPPLETASRLYAAARSAQRLEGSLRKAHRGAERAPAAYGLLVQVLKRVLEEMRDRTSGPLTAEDVPLQLVVTTNTDVWLERELIRARVPFTRVVMHRSGTRVQVNAVEDYLATDDGRTLATGEQKTVVRAAEDGAGLRREDLDRAISRHGMRVFGRGGEPLAELPAYLGDAERSTPLILYKHHGSQDCLDSCAVSTDHYFELASATAAVPSTVTSRISNMPSLILGYSPLDADFRQLYHTLLHRLFDEGPSGLYRFLVQNAPTRSADDTCRWVAESRIWRQVKRHTRLDMKIDVQEVDAKKFLGDLLNQLPVGA
jgi:hypothetical protein